MTEPWTVAGDSRPRLGPVPIRAGHQVEIGCPACGYRELDLRKRDRIPGWIHTDEALCPVCRPKVGPYGDVRLPYFVEPHGLDS